MATFETSNTPVSVNGSAPKAKHSNAVAHDIQLYSALPWEGADVKEIEDFIKANCQQPDRIMQHSWPGEISGWNYLKVVAEAKKAVEDHKDVKGVRLMRNTAEFCASPGQSS
jgi:hypothetical protein